MSILRVLGAVAALLVLTGTADAKRYRHVSTVEYVYDGRVTSHPAGCPWHAFCGCGVSVRVFGHPVKNLFLASNWYRFPRTNPAPGMVVVWRHHVAYIESVDMAGNAVLYDPNSGGHQTRIHTRNIRGATVVNPSGARGVTLQQPQYAANY